MKTINLQLLISGMALLAAFTGCKSSTEEPRVSVIPKPVNIEYSGKELEFDDGVKVVSSDTALDLAAKRLYDRMKELPQAEFLTESKKASVTVRLKLDERIGQAEGYQLKIGRDVTISGKDRAGVLHGIESLLQIIHQAPVTEDGFEIPRLTMTDYPRFGYRGMHLDVSRHFFPPEFIKKYIDLIAMHKMNTFHWHLTDDQGWRIEIKKYPKLTEVGAWRVDHENLPWGERPDRAEGDSAAYGGFYTQDQIREIVAYAAEREITVIPEIEMPGHSAAAIAAYPEYSCSGAQTTVPSGGHTGTNILCAGKDETFTFLEDVLTEVMALFPSKYIHIGGDEAWKKEWENCPLCQKRIQDKGLKDEHELQSYFIRRIDKFLTSKDRILIGWDEILEGGLAENATVMSWRGEAGGIKAAQMGHDVIMTPVDYCYFDYYQSEEKEMEPPAFNGYISLDKVYAYEPVPEELTAEESKHILGAQGNVWTEYMAAEAVVEYRVLPRMTALSEVLWSPKEGRDRNDFMKRLEPFLNQLTTRNYNFFIPAPQGAFKEMIFLDSTHVRLESPWPFATIRYTLDRTEPVVQSHAYEKPFPVGDQTVLKTALFLENGQHGPVKTVHYRKVLPIPPYETDPGELKPGLSYKYYEVSVSSVGAIKKFTPKRTGVTNRIGLPEGHRREVFAAEFIGYLKVPETAVYSFRLTSDDGSQFQLGESLVVDHDGPHGSSAAHGQIGLQKGYYPIYIGYFDGGGGNSLKLEVKRGNDGWQEIPAGYFFHKLKR
ncbi:MAG: family 20 glycosylhydrolase [Prolixibacteraceae bacterium]